MGELHVPLSEIHSVQLITVAIVSQHLMNAFAVTKLICIQKFSTPVINAFWCAEIAHHQEQPANPISHVVQGAATSLRQRFVKNKQTEGRSPGGAALSELLHRPCCLFSRPEREQTICSTF